MQKNHSIKFNSSLLKLALCKGYLSTTHKKHPTMLKISEIVPLMYNKEAHYCYFYVTLY